MKGRKEGMEGGREQRSEVRRRQGWGTERDRKMKEKNEKQEGTEKRGEERR